MRAGLFFMLHTYQSAPFSDPVRQRQFEAIAAALAAEAQAPETILLGNFPVETPSETLQLDAVVVRPRSITLLLLVPQGGLLHIPDFRFSAWRLNDAPLTGTHGTDNPFQQFQQQRDALAAWLAPLLPSDAANLNFIGGLVLFAEPVRFGPEVEERMSAVPAASTFHLLPDPARFTRRLAQLATPEIDLTPNDLEQLTTHLGLSSAAPPLTAAPSLPTPDQPTPYQPSPTDMLRQKAGQLWRWLGAEDLNELDRTDSGYEVDIVAVRNQEKAQLEQMRASLQADLNTQLQALESREAEREQSIARLREQLSAAAPAAPEAATLASRLAVESQEKATIEATMQSYQEQSAARTRELEQKIQQLEALIGQLKPTAEPATAPPPPAAVASSAVPTGDASQSTPTPTQPTAPSPKPWSGLKRPQIGRPADAAQGLLAGLRQWRPRLRQLRSAAKRNPRASLAAAGAAVLVLGWWGLHTSSNTPPTPFREGNRWGLISAGGDTLVPAQYGAIGEFKEKRAVVEHDGVLGFVNEQGQEVVKPAYDALFPYSEGYARARIGRLYTFLDEKGEEFGAYYYSARDFAEGHAAVLDYRGWYYITGPDEPAAEPVTFQEAYSFSKGLARVKTQGAFTFITPKFLADTTEGIKPFSRYANAADFDEHDRARVMQAGRSFFINREGEEVKE